MEHSRFVALVGRTLTLGASVVLAAALLRCGPAKPVGECSGRVAGDLVITEFMADPEGIDEGREYIELYNATTSELSLKGMTLVRAKADGSGEVSHTLSSGAIPAGGYYVLGDAAPDASPSYLNHAYGGALGALGNTSGLIAVRCGKTLIDAVTYQDVGKSGSARAFDGRLVPDSAANDLAENWCDAPLEFEPKVYGSPGAANAPCKGGSGEGCRDPINLALRPVVAPSPGQLVISEVMADPAAVSDTSGEWFEVAALADVDLNGLELSAGGTTATTVTSQDCLRVTSGGYAVFARDLDAGTNGGVTGVTAKLTLSLVNSGATLFVRSGATVIDQATYPAATAGVSSQLDPSLLDAAQNDLASSFCAATVVYGTSTDRGTPGLPNTSCSFGGAATCNDPGSGTSRPIIAPSVGDLVISELMADPAAVADSVGEWFEVAATRDVDLNGVELANEGTGKTVLASPTCLRLAANGHALFARSASSADNGGLPAVTGTFNFSLAATGTRSIILRRDGGVLDQVNYTGAIAGKASQLSQNKHDSTLNDDPASFCAATARYGSAPDGGLGDFGTPGAPNELCP